MKKVLIIDASLKPGWTKKTADAVTERLLASGACICERVSLREEKVAPCKGCALCLERGETSCRYFNDSANVILDKMLWADAIVTICPNYALQVPAILKNLYDRLAYIFHRPRLFGRFSLGIVVQGVYGGGKIVQYINELMSFWGCSIVKGAVISGGLYPNSKLPASVAAKNSQVISAATDRLINAVLHAKPKQPSFFRLALFRMTRSSLRYNPETLAADKKFFADNGWFESRYYTDVKLDPIRSLFGMFIDRLMKRMITRSSMS
jgi:multimeric flavodoxin WrbA